MCRASSGAQKDGGIPEEYSQRYTSTGIFECVRTLTVSLPRTTAATPRRPCEAITIKSHLLASAASRRWSPPPARWDSPPKIRFAPDSPLEEDGFEPSVPLG